MKLNFALLPLLFFFGALYFVNDQTDGQVVRDFHTAIQTLGNLGRDRNP